MAKYKLTNEGKGYLKNGLPEKNLVEFLKSKTGAVSIDEAQKTITNFHVALKWALEKNWVEKKLKVLWLKKYPEKIPEQEALEKIEKGEEVDEEIVKILTQRNLVKMITEVYKKTEEALAKKGNIIDELTHDMLLTKLWKGKKFRPVKFEFKKGIEFKKTGGNFQPYNHFLNEVRKKLVNLGFIEMVGPAVELEFWNFDALFQPQNHPARDWASTYSVKYPKYGRLPSQKIVENVKAAHENGWKTGSSGWQYRWDPRKAMLLMPRAHGTALSARTLASKPKIPGKYFAMVRCYRPDVIDATHGVEFYQTEGIILDEGLTFKNLLGILKMFAIEIAGTDKVKFVPDYYPFTEPSAQLSAKHPELGWIEFGGSGIFREELTRPLGINVPVIAWGIGIDRLAMFKLGLNDIRHLFSQNLDWLRSQKVV